MAERDDASRIHVGYKVFVGFSKEREVNCWVMSAWKETRGRHGSEVRATRLPTCGLFCHCLRHLFWTDVTQISEHAQESQTTLGIRVGSACFFRQFIILQFYTSIFFLWFGFIEI